MYFQSDRVISIHRDQTGCVEGAVYNISTYHCELGLDVVTNGGAGSGPIGARHLAILQDKSS